MDAAAALRSELRPRAWFVVFCFAATLAFGLLLLFAFEPDVQEADAAELVDRADDARAFLIADLFFPLLYGLLSPIAQWRFGVALEAREGAAAHAVAVPKIVLFVAGALLAL